MEGLHASSSNNVCMVQTSEYTFSERATSADEQFEVAYRQLWLYAMRHYPQMPRDPKRKERLARPGSATANERVVSGMGHLAHRLGFNSSEIQELIAQAPDRLIARNALLQARDPETFDVDDATIDSIVGHIITCFDMIRPKGVVTVPPTRVSRSVPRKFRSGHPTLKALVQDRALLFLDHIHDAAVPDLVTTAFVRRCVYLAFFGARPAVGQASNSVYCPTPLLFVPESRPSQIHHDQDPLQHMCNSITGFGQPIEAWNHISPSIEVDHNRPKNHTTAGPVAERRPSQTDTEYTREEAEFQESTSHAVQGFHHQMTTNNMTRQHQQASSTMAMYATELRKLPKGCTEGAINTNGEPCPQKGGDLHCEPMEEISNDDVAAGAINNTHQLDNEQRAQTHRKNISRNSYTGKINIVLYIYDENYHWNIATIVRVNPAEPSSTSEFKRTVQRYKQRGIILCDMKMRSVSISSSLSAAMADGQNLLLLFPPGTRRLCQSPAIPRGVSGIN
ncbi:hypothetical protein BDV37DRAFT_292161 [Aspergillus pseudonomiae]|uniref:Uncharacterized protein n=1 Tax=Aspergillus pseudonomiae TaxID=1506151 RepID=A0A5N7CUV2_9EURO|nr:uncharacterized protein BDV37DRAFT_292161 [Aspergillus pseudonomiae]KAE8397383.1 hypothetical protein BDV37DRAFT_292161 [Aspergillus pseudonomiae]